MGRFLLTVILALGIGTVIAWQLGLGPWAPTPPESFGDPAKSAFEWGKPLFAPFQAPAAVVIDDAPKGWTRARREFVLTEASVHPKDKHEVSAARDGILSFIGTRVYQEDPLATQPLPTAKILVGGKEVNYTYRPLKQGDYVEDGQMIALVNPTMDDNEMLERKTR